MSLPIKEKGEAEQLREESAEPICEPSSVNILDNIPTTRVGQKASAFSSDANKGVYYRELGNVGDELLQHWLSLHQLALPVYTLKYFARLLHKLYVSSAEQGVGRVAELAKEIELDLIALMRDFGSSNPEIEETIELKLIVLDKVCKNEASQVGQLIVAKVVPIINTRPLVYWYEPDSATSTRLAKHLSMAGFNVVAYRYLEDVEEAMQQKAPEVMIADIDFQCEGGLTGGFKRLEHIRQLHPKDIPLILTSNEEHMGARAIAVKAGVCSFLLKPISMPMLTRKILELTHEQCVPSTKRQNRILLIDPSQKSAMLYKKGLFNAGFETHWLADYNKAIFAARDSLPDLIILNITQRNFNPVHLVRLLKQDTLTADCEIIILAADHQQKFYVGLAEEGVSDFVSRPISAEDLIGLAGARLKGYRCMLAERIFDARFDLNTQLYNLTYFEQQVRYKLTNNVDQAYFALLHIEIDQAKQILEKYGVSRFRVLCYQIAQLIIDHLEPGDLSARYSDSGFLLLYKPQRLRELDLYCRALCSKISDFSLDSIDSGYHVTASVGVCQIENEVYDLAKDNAIAASRLAQKLGGNRVEWNTALKLKDERQQATRKELVFLQEAIDEQRLLLLFQPIASLAVEDIERYDVLLRLLDGEGNEVEPFEFINAAREHDMSRYIDRWVVHAAIKELSEHTERGVYPRLFIKVSIDTAKDVKFIPWLEQLLSKYEVRSEQCIFVLEELEVIQHSRAVKPFFSKLHTLGCRLQISGFGKVSQGLELLKSFKLDYVKLSPSLIDGIDDDPEKQNRLTYICSLAGQHQVKVTASCIEDPRQLVSLCRFGIDLFQGYMLQKPSRSMDYEFSTEI